MGGLALLLDLGRAALGSKTGRTIGLILLVALILGATYAGGALWVHRITTAAYDRGYAKRKAEDDLATAKLQSKLDTVQALSAQQAAQLAAQQANTDALVKGWTDAIPSGAPAPSPADLRDLANLWNAARRAN